MRHEIGIKAIHGLGAAIWSMAVSAPIVASPEPDYRLAAVYGGFGCMAALLLPLWSQRYRTTTTSLACIVSGAIVGALVGPAAYDYWGQSGMAVLTAAICSLVAPAIIANPHAAYTWLMQIIRAFRGGQK